MALVPIDHDGLLIERETGGYGVDPTPTATDFVRIAERAWLNIPEEWEYPNDRETTAGGDIVGVRPALPRGRVVTITAPVEVRGSGDVDTPPEDAEALRACAMIETINAVTSVVYTRDISLHDSVTAYAFAGGLRYIVRGGRGTFTEEINGGEVVLRRYTLQGIMVDDPTEQSVPTIDYTAAPFPALPLTAVDVTCTVGGTQLDIEGVTVDWAADVQRVRSAGINNGLDGLKIAIPRLRPLITIRTKLEALATYNPWSDNRQSTARALVVRYGTAGGNRFTWNVATAYVGAPAEEDQSGFAGLSLPFRCRDATMSLTHD